MRDSLSCPGDCVLSVMQDNQVWFYQLHRCGNDPIFVLLELDLKRHGLEALIKHCMENPSKRLKLKGFALNENPPDLYCASGKSNLLHL